MKEHSGGDEKGTEGRENEHKEDSGGGGGSLYHSFGGKLEMEEVFSMAVVVGGSVLYVLSPDAMLPIVVLVSVTLLVCAVLCDWTTSCAPSSSVVADGATPQLTEMYYFRRRLSMLDLTSAAWMWWAFLLYAILFRDVPILLPKSLDYVQSTGAVIIALLSYWRAFAQRRPGMLGAMLLVQMLLMVAPHRDAVSHSRATFIFGAKVVLFLLFYSATRVVQMFASDHSIGGVFDAHYYAFSQESVSMPLRVEYMYSLLQRVIQTFWILLADKHVFFVGLCIQLVVFFGTVVAGLLPMLKNNLNNNNNNNNDTQARTRRADLVQVSVQTERHPSSYAPPQQQPLPPPSPAYRLPPPGRRPPIPSRIVPSPAEQQQQRPPMARHVPSSSSSRFRPVQQQYAAAARPQSEIPPPTSEEVKSFLLQTYHKTSAGD